MRLERLGMPVLVPRVMKARRGLRMLVVEIEAQDRQTITDTVMRLELHLAEAVQARAQRQLTKTLTLGIGTKKIILERSIASSSIYGAIVGDLSMTSSLHDHQIP